METAVYTARLCRFVIFATALVPSMNILVSFGRTIESKPLTKWRRVAIGGGGYVTGLVQSTNAVYARTDVGGAYILPFKNVTTAWRQMMEWVPTRLSNYYSVESIAVLATSDRQEDDILYAAVGDGFRMPSAILTSNNGGATFSNSSYVVPMAGNGEYRWCGERLAISLLSGVNMDGRDGHTVFFGSRTHGVLRSTNGSRWEPVQGLPVLPDPGYTFILTDDNTGTVVAGAFGHGIWVSRDVGDTWHFRGGPRFPCRAAQHVSGAIVVTSNSTRVGAVATFHPDSPSTGEWVDLTPAGNQTYTGVALDSRTDELYVATHTAGYHNHIYTTQLRERFWEPRKFSIKSAEHSAATAGDSTTLTDRIWQPTWRNINNVSLVNYSADVPWWGPSKFCSSVAALLLVDGALLTSTWYGVWIAHRSDGFHMWTTREAGHEETVVQV